MAFAWGLLIPVGIILALFYKVVWPNGHWFYVSVIQFCRSLYSFEPVPLYPQIHVMVMVIAVLMVIAGVVIILLHAEWKWLDTTVSDQSVAFELNPKIMYIYTYYFAGRI